MHRKQIDFTQAAAKSLYIRENCKPRYSPQNRRKQHLDYTSHIWPYHSVKNTSPHPSSAIGKRLYCSSIPRDIEHAPRLLSPPIRVHPRQLRRRREHVQLTPRKIDRIGLETSRSVPPPRAYYCTISQNLSSAAHVTMDPLLARANLFE